MDSKYIHTQNTPSSSVHIFALDYICTHAFFAACWYKEVVLPRIQGLSDDWSTFMVFCFSSLWGSTSVSIFLCGNIRLPQRYLPQTAVDIFHNIWCHLGTYSCKVSRRKVNELFYFMLNLYKENEFFIFQH